MVSLTDPNDFAEKSKITSVLLGRLQPGSGDRYELLLVLPVENFRALDISKKTKFLVTVNVPSD